MLISGDKVAEMPREVLVNVHHTPCSQCGVPLRESITGCRSTQIGPICSDCYFKLLSDHIDENPINLSLDME